MKYICTVSAALRLGFWMFLAGVVCGLFIGLHA
jgi:hypothetical protein